MKKTAQEKFNRLRRQAEELMKDKDFDHSPGDVEDPLKLIHKLQTFQIELELQNEELHRSQQALMESHTSYTELYDVAPVGYITLSIKGMILKSNLTFADMLSVERTYLTNQPLSAHIVFNDQDIYYRHRQKLFESKTRQICELRLIKREDQPFHVRLESTTVLNKSGDPVQYRTVIIDISERKQAEEKLQEFKSIVASSFDLIALIDTNFVYLAVNDAYLKVLHKHRDEIIGHSVSEIFGEDFFKKAIKPNAEHCMNGYDVRFSDWFEFPVLGRRYMDVQYSPYKSHDKEIKGFVVNARDITLLKQSEDLLEYNKLQLETVLNNIDSSIYITDMKTNEILFINKHMKKHFSVDLIGKVCWKSFHENQGGPCDFCTNEKLIDADGAPAEPHVWETYNQKLNKWYELHDAAIPWMDGNLVRLEIATDITERKRMEEKEKQIKIILEKKVKERTADLEDMNAALKVLLKKREEDRKEIEEKIFANYKYLLSPIIDNLKKNLSIGKNQDMINILESELKNIMSPFSKKLSDKMINLTPTEIHVADFIKLGKSNKEISSILDSSVHTISRHRENIRKKTGLKNKKINLRSFLLTLR